MQKEEKFNFGIYGLCVMLALFWIFLMLTSFSGRSPHDDRIAGATLCALANRDLLVDNMKTISYHTENGAVYIDGVTYEDGNRESIRSANTRTIDCGTVSK